MLQTYHLPLASTLDVNHSMDMDKMSGAIDNQTASHLFNLPTELRLRIYEEVLTLPLPNKPLKWCHTYDSYYLTPSVLTLLETCRRINLEAEPIFYSINRLTYPALTIPAAPRLIHAIGPTRRHAVEKLTIVVVTSGDFLAVIPELIHFPRLRELRVQRRMSARFTDPRHWKVMAEQIISEFAKLGQLRKLEFATPPTREPTPDEQERMCQLNELDEYMMHAVSLQNNDMMRINV